jgi:hypothetical protein
MPEDCGTDKGEAQADPRYRAYLRSWHPIKWLEEGRQVLLRNAGAEVGHRYLPVLTIGSHLQVHLTLGRTELDGVVEQVAENPHQRIGIAVHTCVGQVGGVGGDSDLTRLLQGPRFIDCVGYDGEQIHLLSAPLFGFRLHELKIVIHQGQHALGMPQEALVQERVFTDWAEGLPQPNERNHRSQRRSQVVREEIQRRRRRVFRMWRGRAIDARQ